MHVLTVRQELVMYHCDGIFSSLFFLRLQAHAEMFPQDSKLLLHNSLEAFKFTRFNILALTLNIPSLGRQGCLPSWGPRRTPWFFFVISQLFDAVDYSNYIFWVSETIIQ